MAVTIDRPTARNHSGPRPARRRQRGPPSGGAWPFR
jgi:hypothetical protein